MNPRRLSVLFLPLLAGCHNASPMTVISDSVEPLRARFNAHADRPRIIAFFSPS